MKRGRICVCAHDGEIRLLFVIIVYNTLARSECDGKPKEQKKRGKSDRDNCLRRDFFLLTVSYWTDFPSLPVPENQQDLGEWTSMHRPSPQEALDSSTPVCTKPFFQQPPGQCLLTSLWTSVYLADPDPLGIHTHSRQTREHFICTRDALMPIPSICASIGTGTNAPNTNTLRCSLCQHEMNGRKSHCRESHAVWTGIGCESCLSRM